MTYDYDAAFPQACAAVSAAGYASNGLLHDRLSISYVKAVVLIEMLQRAGIVGCELDDAAQIPGRALCITARCRIRLSVTDRNSLPPCPRLHHPASAV